LSVFGRCTAHFERMQRRPSVQRLMAFEKTVLDQLANAS
jgi:hypothetical protein